MVLGNKIRLAMHGYKRVQYSWNDSNMRQSCQSKRYVLIMKLATKFVTWTSQMGLKLVKFHFYFSDWFYTPFVKLPLTTNITEIGQMVPKIYCIQSLRIVLVYSNQNSIFDFLKQVAFRMLILFFRNSIDNVELVHKTIALKQSWDIL